MPKSQNERERARVLQNRFKNIRGPRGVKSSPLLCWSFPESQELTSEVPDWLLRMPTTKARRFAGLDLDPQKTRILEKLFHASLWRLSRTVVGLTPTTNPAPRPQEGRREQAESERGRAKGSNIFVNAL